MSAALELRSVTKKHADGEGVLVAVHDVSFSLERGSATLLAGPSGSGKTTLLMMMAALSSPTSGEVHVLGQPVSRFREHHRTAFRRDHLGVVLQDLLLVPDLDALDNVLLPSVPLGISDSDVTRAHALLGRLGLAVRKGTKSERLSGGERQRVALARALLRSPEILLLDEPTAHLDDESTASLLDALYQEREAGRTIVIATHDPRLLEGFEGRAVFRMRAGRIV